jgi:CMP-N-acetylneuraminic acid synthetase
MNSRSDSLISVNAHPVLSPMILYRQAEGFGVPFDPGHNKGVRRQDQSPVLIRNGAIYLARTAFIRERRTLICDKPLLYVMPEERSINVDSISDLEKVRCRLEE